jgi:hypothetical protein
LFAQDRGLTCLAAIFGIALGDVNTPERQL